MTAKICIQAHGWQKDTRITIGQIAWRNLAADLAMYIEDDTVILMIAHEDGIAAAKIPAPAFETLVSIFDSRDTLDSITLIDGDNPL